MTITWTGIKALNFLFKTEAWNILIIIVQLYNLYFL